MSAPTPLLDFFRRGEVPREVRMLAAQGVLAPRAHEQIGILILLTDDRDIDVRETALRTIDALPGEALRAYLGRSDVPVGVREFFGDKGIFPAEIPALAADDPLLDVLAHEPEDAPDDEPAADGEEETGATLLQKVQRMSITDKLKAAMRGSREMRAILIRDPNKMIGVAVLSSPKVSESEIESFAKMATIPEDILRVIAMNRAWLKNYGIVLALTKNPKTPVGLSLNMLSRLNDRDLAGVSTDRNVPDPLRVAARRKIVLGDKR
ncbi:MAG: hypothetical protein U0Q55_21900 [Vicinamibacterales bacterium]